MTIRKPTMSDLPAIEKILLDTDLFPSEALSEMIKPFFEANTEHQWWVLEEAQGVLGFSYARAEELAEGTWNLLAIGFRAEHQGKGLGSQLLSHAEHSLRGERILIIDTSGLPEFEATRRFYAQRGYTFEATIRDYWADGDDKVTFWKSLVD